MARQPRGGTELGWSSFKAAFPGKVSYLTCLSGKTLPAWLPVLDLVQSSPSLKPFPRERQQATGATSKMRPWGGGSPVLLLFTLLRAGRGFRTPGDAGRRPELLEQKAIRCGGGGPPPQKASGLSVTYCGGGRLPPLHHCSSCGHRTVLTLSLLGACC